MFRYLEQSAKETAFVVVAAKQKQQNKNQNQHTDAAVIAVAVVLAATSLWPRAAFLWLTTVIMIIAHKKTSHSRYYFILCEVFIFRYSSSSAPARSAYVMMNSSSS